MYTLVHTVSKNRLSKTSPPAVAALDMMTAASQMTVPFVSWSTSRCKSTYTCNSHRESETYLYS
jgi:hypothetical protein